MSDNSNPKPFPIRDARIARLDADGNPVDPQPLELPVTVRMFEQEPPDARLLFRRYDRVKTTRALFGGIPAGAPGEIIALEHPESVMSSKGRPYYVRFDLDGFNVPFSHELRAYYEATRKPGDPEMPQYVKAMSTNAGANDLELVERGSNWNPGYVHEYESDRLADAIANMSPDEFRQYISGVLSDLSNGKLSSANRQPGTPPELDTGDLSK